MPGFLKSQRIVYQRLVMDAQRKIDSGVGAAWTGIHTALVAELAEIDAEIAARGL